MEVERLENYILPSPSSPEVLLTVAGWTAILCLVAWQPIVARWKRIAILGAMALVAIPGQILSMDLLFLLFRTPGRLYYPNDGHWLDANRLALMPVFLMFVTACCRQVLERRRKKKDRMVSLGEGS